MIVFNAVGYASVIGLAFGITLRLEQVYWAAPGLLCYVSLLHEERRAEGTPFAPVRAVPVPIPDLRGKE